MKIYQKAAFILAGTMMASSAMPVCASELKNEMQQTANVISVARAAQVTTAPSLSVDVKTSGGNTYLYIYTEDAAEMEYVRVEGYNADQYSNYWRYKITSTGTYDVEVKRNNGRTNSTSKYICIDNVPDITLSKITSGSYTYIRVRAYANSDIKKVIINDETYDDFPEDGGTKDYRITKSGKYTVEVIDDNNHSESKDIIIDLDEDAPTVSLDKKKVNGKWQLIITYKPNDNNKIQSIKVDGSSVSYDRDGGEIKYEAKNTKTYNVVVKDSSGLETSKSLYIDINEGGEDPTLTVTPAVGSIMITTKDDNKISSVTVNGQAIAMSAGGGTVRYPVTMNGNYTVVVTDVDGNQTSKSVFAYANNTVVNTNTGRHTVIFKLNSRSWSLDGVSQSMDSAAAARNGRIYIPFRYVANALGISAGNIIWDNNTKTVIINDNGSIVKVPLNSKKMTVGNQTITMDAASLQIGGRVMVPISQVAKAFPNRNVTMQWQSAAKQVVITRS